MGMYVKGKNLSKKQHWSNFKNGFMDTLIILISFIILLSMFLGLLGLGIFIVLKLEYWSIPLFIIIIPTFAGILSVIDNGFLE